MINHEIMSVATRIMVMAIILSVILLFVGIGLLVVVHVCIVGRAFRRGFGDVSVVERASGGNRSMSRDDLEKLPCYDYITKDTANCSPVDCAVCLETFKMGEKCRLLPFCKHSFHAQCVDEWLLRTPICPICRSSADSRRGGGGDESGCFSDISVELRGSQTTTGSSNLGESQRVESNQFSELRDIQTQESIELSVTISESDESQTSIVGNQSITNNIPTALPQEDVPERLPV